MRKLIETHKQLLVKVILVLAALMVTKIVFEMKHNRAIVNPEYSGKKFKIK